MAPTRMAAWSSSWTTSPPRGLAGARADALVLVAAAVEGSSYVEVASAGDDTMVVDALTGMVDEQTPFRSHGHMLQLRIRLRHTG
jgi:hypothetical protein